MTTPIEGLKRNIADLQGRIEPTRRDLRDVKGKVENMSRKILLQSFKILCEGQQSFLVSYEHVLAWNAILLDLLPEELHDELQRRIEDLEI